MARQNKMDWVRAQQLTLLREAVLPATMVTEGKRQVRVKPPVLKSLLQMINKYSRDEGSCWTSAATLSKETGLGMNTVLRGLEALQKLNLIIVETKRQHRTTVFSRRIAFVNLIDFHAEISAQERAELTREFEVPTEQKVEIPTEQKIEVPTEQKIEVPTEQKVEVPTEQKVEVPTEGFEVPTEQFSGTHRAVLRYPPVGTEVITEGNLKFHRSVAREAKNGGGGVLDVVGQAGGSGSAPLIPRLDPEALTQPELIDALYEIAVERGMFRRSEQHRLAWWSWCRRLSLWRAGQMRKGREPPNVVGYLHRVLENGVENAVSEALRMHTNADEDWARSAIKDFDNDTAWP